MIFITGGTGFIGKSLVRKLVDGGEKVKLLVRKNSPLDGLDGDSHISFFNGELTDKEDILRGLEGCTKVIHAAAMVKTWVRDRSQFDHVNVEGLKAVAQASLESNIEKFCYISSFMALGPTDGTTATEDSPYPDHGWHNDYERTKYLADRHMGGFIEKGLPAVVLYPGVVYGPGRVTGGNIIVRIIIDFYKGKIPGILGDGSGMWSYAFVEDVAQGVVHAMNKGENGQRYILGGDNLSMEQFFDTLSRLLNKKKPGLRIPYWLGKAAGFGEEVIALLFGREPVNTRGTVEIFKHDWALSSQKAERELGYHYRSLSKGLAVTINWMREKGLLPEK